jgi:glycosyltransferase involved in cell wall biosynthesis
MKKIVVLGPGPGFKNGIAPFAVSLSKALDNNGVQVNLLSWTEQFPFFLPRDEIDKGKCVDKLPDTNVKVHYTLNYNNIFSWHRTYKKIVELNPDFVVFQWAHPIQALPIGYIVKHIKAYTDIKVVVDYHFSNRKEYSKLVKRLTTYAIEHADAYVVHSFKAACEIKEFLSKTKLNLVETNGIKPKSDSDNDKTLLTLYHPVYDMYTSNLTFDAVAQKQALNLRRYVFLFFGFHSKYKGLHNAIAAFAELAKNRDDVSLLIAGEANWQSKNRKRDRLKRIFSRELRALFFGRKEDERNYVPLEMIDQLAITDRVTVIDSFVPVEDVHKYFQVSDAILLFYETSTASGIESIAYNFKIPIVATNAGHFPETVKEGITGYLADVDDIQSMAEAMLKIIENPLFPENIERVAKELNWGDYAKSVANLFSQ